MAGQGRRLRRRELPPGWLSQAVLAAAAALGWALYLRERRSRRLQQEEVQQAPCSAREDAAISSDAIQARLGTPRASAAEAEGSAAAVVSQQQAGASGMVAQGALAAEEVQQGSSLEKEEAQLRGLALELEALAAQLNQDVLLSARSARSARAVAATSPATLQPEELSSASPAMNAFQQRLSPLLLRPLSARSNLSSATSTPMAAGSPEHVPSAATPGQQGGQWSPKPTVARLAGLQLRPGSSSSASEAASPASMAATPASLGRMLRQGGLAGEQLSRGLACYQEQQQQVAAAAREGAAASPAADGTDDGVGSTRAEFPRSDSSMLQAPENKRAAPQRPSSAPVRRKQLAQRPPTPSAAGGSSADFRIPAYKGSGTPRAHGPSPAGSTRVSKRLANKSATSKASTPAAARTPEWTF